jgi:putative peptidoglycan lipid II flippase
MGLLAASGMIALGKPAIDLVFTGGRFSAADSSQCAAYFAVFSISLFLWSAQAIYSRAFYAAGNTFVPMAAGTIVTAISLPIYIGLFHGFGAMGLAFASDIGIAMQTLAIAGLLHQRHMVSLASLDYRELGRCLAAALTGGAITWIVFSWMAGALIQRMHLAAHSRLNDLVALAAGGLLWGAISLWVLGRTGSALPKVMMKRLRLA